MKSENSEEQIFENLCSRMDQYFREMIATILDQLDEPQRGIFLDLLSAAPENEAWRFLSEWSPDEALFFLRTGFPWGIPKDWRLFYHFVIPRQIYLERRSKWPAATRRRALQTVERSRCASDAVSHLSSWVSDNLTYDTERYGKANAPIAILRTRRGDCTNYSILLAALCRSVCIPARVVNGRYYSENLLGGPYLGGHTWVEAYVEENRWIHVDPTLKLFDEPSTYLEQLERHLVYVTAYDPADATWINVTPHYNLEPLESMLKHTKELLAQARREKHTEDPSDISEDEYAVLKRIENMLQYRNELAPEDFSAREKLWDESLALIKSLRFPHQVLRKPVIINIDSTNLRRGGVNLLKRLKSHGVDGIGLDFKTLPSPRRLAFLRRIKSSANSLGLKTYGILWCFRNSSLAREHPRLTQIDRFGKRKSDWICPTYSKSKRLLLSLTERFLSTSVLDGLFLSYVSYSHFTNTCFCKRCRSKFYEEYGLQLEGIQFPTKDYEVWSKWRCEQISEFLKSIREIVDRKHPSVDVGVIHIPIHSFARGQDYRSFSEIFDIVSPVLSVKRSSIYILGVLTYVSKLTRKEPDIYVFFDLHRKGTQKWKTADLTEALQGAKLAKVKGVILNEFKDITPELWHGIHNILKG